MKIISLTKSDRRDSNPRPPPWQGGVLPTVLLSHIKYVLLFCVHQNDIQYNVYIWYCQLLFLIF